NLNSVKVEKVASSKAGTFAKISAAGFQTTQLVGAPELPVRSFLVVGHPEDIQVRLNVRKSETLTNTRPSPAQPQACRCDVTTPAFEFNEAAYLKAPSQTSAVYIGSFRGT
ncbi:MAG: hypothetical protein V4736_06030, partial [Bdellovibrionota bacterium]